MSKPKKSMPMSKDSHMMTAAEMRKMMAAKKQGKK